MFHLVISGAFIRHRIKTVFVWFLAEILVRIAEKKFPTSIHLQTMLFTPNSDCWFSLSLGGLAKISLTSFLFRKRPHCSHNVVRSRIGFGWLGLILWGWGKVTSFVIWIWFFSFRWTFEIFSTHFCTPSVFWHYGVWECAVFSKVHRTEKIKPNLRTSYVRRKIS